MATVFLSPHAWAEGTLDQEFSSLPVTQTAPITPALWYGTAVTPQLTGLLDRVDVYVQRSSGTAQDLTMTIYDTDAGTPSGPALASLSLSATSVPSTYDWVPFTFSGPARVTAGSQFAVVLSTADTNSLAYVWAATSTGLTSPYPGGYASYNQGAGWTNISNFSQWFRTYVTAPPSTNAQTPPPVLQQFELAPDQLRAQARCDSQASSELNCGGAVSGGWGTSWAQWANGGQGGPVCTRTLAYSEAFGRWAAE